jgi:hypothetical protein
METVGQELHTILSFDLPFRIEIPDGFYEVKVDDRTALISAKQAKKTSVAGWSSTGGNINLMFDKYGLSGFSHIDIKFPWKMSAREDGRQAVLFAEPRISAPRNKNKEVALRFVNRLIEAVRVFYGQFHLRNVSYSDVLSWKQFYWDGKKRYRVCSHMFDQGCGGMRMTAGKPSEEQIREQETKLKSFREILKNADPLALDSLFLANAKEACLEEDFRMATVEAVTALEVVLYDFIQKRGHELKIPEKDLKDFIVKVGLTGNIRIVLRMLTEGREQSDEEEIGWCSGAITTRNKILHEGLRVLSPSETESRIENIERMIAYLRRIQGS